MEASFHRPVVCQAFAQRRTRRSHRGEGEGEGGAKVLKRSSPCEVTAGQGTVWATVLLSIGPLKGGGGGEGFPEPFSCPAELNPRSGGGELSSIRSSPQFTLDNTGDLFTLIEQSKLCSSLPAQRPVFVSPYSSFSVPSLPSLFSPVLLRCSRRAPPGRTGGTGRAGRWRWRWWGQRRGRRKME